MRRLLSALVVIPITLGVSTSGLAALPASCARDSKSNECVNYCYQRPERAECLDFCDNAANPKSVGWCGSFCSDAAASAHPFCTNLPREAFGGPQIFFQFFGEIAGHLYQEQDAVLAAVPTFGVRFTSAFSVIVRGWLGPVGIGAHNGATYSTELGGGLGLDIHLFDVIHLHQDAISALDLSLVAGPWMSGCGDRVCTWTPALVSAQIGFTPHLIRNAAVSSYSGLTFGLEGGAGYDFDGQHWVARVGLYVGVELAAK